jgi:hypothetical protein
MDVENTTLKRKDVQEMMEEKAGAARSESGPYQRKERTTETDTSKSYNPGRFGRFRGMLRFCAGGTNALKPGLSRSGANR